MAITLEQYRELRNSGLTKEQIVSQQSQGITTDGISKGFGAVFGGRQIGQAIGTQIAKGTFGGGVRRAVTGIDLPKNAEQFVEEGPGAVEVGGGVAQIALTLATLGGVGTAGGLLARTTKGGVVGGGFGISQALKENKPEEAVSRAFFGGVLGISLPILGTGIEVGKKLLTQKLPERMMKTIFKQANDDLTLAWQTQARGEPLNPTLAKEALDRGLRGSSRNMAVYSIKKTGEFEQQLQNKLAGRSVKLPQKNGYIRLLTEIRDKLDVDFSPSAKLADDLINQIKKTKGNVVSAELATSLKRFMDSIRNTSSFRLDPTLSAKQEAFKSAADIARTTIKKQIPGTAEILNEQRFFIQATDAIIADAVKRQNKALLNLTDIVLGGGGFAVGGGLLGAAGPIAAIRGFQQPIGITNIAQGLKGFGQAVPPIPEAARALGRLGILKGSQQGF